MNLEDHVGDVISKARTSANVSAEDAAAAAGLGIEEFSALEESGRVATRPDFAALGAKLGLQGAKLERIADGGLPAKRGWGRRWVCRGRNWSGSRTGGCRRSAIWANGGSCVRSRPPGRVTR